jgi:hypothetical protein
MWYKWRYIHVEQVEIQPCGTRGDTAMWNKWIYSHVEHVEIQPCGTSGDTAALVLELCTRWR